MVGIYYSCGQRSKVLTGSLSSASSANYRRAELIRSRVLQCGCFEDGLPTALQHSLRLAKVSVEQPEFCAPCRIDMDHGT